LIIGSVIGSNQVMAAVKQNTLKRRGVGLRASDADRVFPRFPLFAPHFVDSSDPLARKGSPRLESQLEG
jgi:hypothetical protein